MVVVITMDKLQIRMGQAVGMRELVATLIVSGILLIVGVTVFSKVKASMPNLTSADANTTVTSIETTAYDSFELATVALIVLAAAVIIGILIRATVANSKES